jgi:hypothetical protein
VAIERQARELAVRGEPGEAEAQNTIWPAVTDVISDVVRMNETLHPMPRNPVGRPVVEGAVSQIAMSIEVLPSSPPGWTSKDAKP